MKNEFENPKGAEPLSKEAAHEEANLLRAQMNVSPETGKVMQSLEPKEDREATAEEYDKALAAVEDLKRLVEEQPESLKLMQKLNKPVEQLISTGGLGVMFLMRASAALSRLGKPGGVKRGWDRASILTEIGPLFDDAERQLRDLKARGEQISSKEKEKAD